MNGWTWQAGRMIGRAVLGLALTLLLVPQADALEPGPSGNGLAPEVSGAASILANFVARFRFAGGAREDAARLEAIETCVEEMSFILRPFARSRLRSATSISREIAFDVNEAVLAIEESGDVRKEVKLEAPPVAWKSGSGDTLRLTLHRDGARLLLRSAGEDGEERRVLSLSPDGKKLTIDVTILADRLPLPVRYQLSYRRLPGSDHRVPGRSDSATIDP